MAAADRCRGASTEGPVDAGPATYPGYRHGCTRSSGGQSGAVIDGDAATFAARLRTRSDCLCEAGLTAAELRRAEDHLNIEMPPLWRTVLSLVHPVELPEPSRGLDGLRRWTRFPDWRLRDLDQTRAMVEAPVKGVLFDVAENGFWWRAWGEPPSDPGLGWRTRARRWPMYPSLHLYGTTSTSAVTMLHLFSALCRPTCTSRS